MSTVESVDSSGCSYNPTKSLCSPIVFNTAITRAKSLIVAVGNPYTLMTVEENTAAAENMEISNLHCWAKYLDHCFEANTVILANKDDKIEGNLQNLHLFVKQKLQKDTPVSVFVNTVIQHVTNSCTCMCLAPSIVSNMCAWFILTQGASLNVEPNTVDTTVGELNGEIIR